MITLPKLFEKKLEENPSLAASVRESFSRFEPWLANSGMPFFPAFTDHSPRHIAEVLETAASLISDTSHELLSPEDVAVLCMSILLHDCGMHLTQDSFRLLISDTGPPIIAGLGDLPWAQIWSEYLAEANRFGQEKLIAIFGDTEPVVVSLLNLDNLTERDHLLIGEFVRRHHTRLAHEIALKGVTRSGGSILSFDGFDPEIKDIAGLVARSHGMAIRSTFEYIRARYNLVPIYRNIKIPYLMAVLRIADYVQVKSERAIKALLSVKELRSPVSRQEWLAHFAVRDVHTHHDDPEALYVHAAPADTKTYLKLVALFKDIQRELDESWGTLGEVYGRNADLGQLGLSIRRVRSNMDSVENFAKTVTYIPTNARFDSSGPDLLKLLVGPLYDYEYEVGIRELVQNAADACRERRDLRLAESADKESSEFDILVEIEESEDGTGLVTITDRGVGMTLDTVKKYFLIAGASFRNSELWKRQHTEENGTARVIRGGRFGVGALAAFLLGDEIRVWTRHVGRAELEGIEFSARIDDPVVELRKCKAPIGTKIQIWVSNNEVLKRLRPSGSLYYGKGGRVEYLDDWVEMDWFVQAQPRILFKWHGFNYSSDENFTDYNERYAFHAEFKPPQYRLVPLDGREEEGWRVLPDQEPYKAILWRYMPKRTVPRGDGEVVLQPADQIVVNGIHVQYVYDHARARIVELPEGEKNFGPEYRIRRPSLAIYDPAGICPINLQRNAVAFGRMDIDRKLGSILLETHFEKLKSISECKTFGEFRQVCDSLEADRSIMYEGQLYPLCISKKGIFLASPKSISELGINALIFTDMPDSDGILIKDVLHDNEAVMIRRAKWGHGKQASLSWFRGIFALDSRWVFSHSRGIGIPGVVATSQASLIPLERWVMANERGKVARTILNEIREIEVSDSHVIAAMGTRIDESKIHTRIKELSRAMPHTGEIAVWTLESKQPNAKVETLILSAWYKVFGSPALSFTKRRRDKAIRPTSGKPME